MDAERYAQIRDLFLAAEELPEDERATFVREQAVHDEDLIRQVLELLDEHDPEAAKAEGDRSSIPSAARVKSTDQVGDGPDSKTGRDRSDTNEGPVKSQRRAPAISSDSTLKWAQRTHAQPRHLDDMARPEKPIEFVAPRARTATRNRSQIWITALGLLGVVVPTLLMGWLTSQNAAQSICESESTILRAACSSAVSKVSLFLDRETRKAQSWADDPNVRLSIDALVELAREQGDVPSPEFSLALSQSPHSDSLAASLRQLAKNDQVEFAVWNRSGNTLATTMRIFEPVGEPVTVDLVEQLSHVMRGKAQLFGPTMLASPGEAGTSNQTQSGPDPIVMGMICPVRNEAGQVEAALMIAGTDLYARFNEMVSTAIDQDAGDCYMVNAGGVLVTHSQHAHELVLNGVIQADDGTLATRLLVADPGTEKFSGDLRARFGKPLTHSAPNLVRQGSGASSEPYRNYAGELVNGVWYWFSDYDIGLITERDHERSLAPARSIMSKFWYLSGLLSVVLLGASYFSGLFSKKSGRPDPLLQYEIGEPIGSGGMGVVFRAKHRHLGRPTALKVLRPDRQEPDDLLRFDREARVAAALDNPHIVTIYDYGRTADGEFYTAMEFLRGLTLNEVVARSGPQSIGRVLCILRQICDAIIGAHAASLLHRDLKPQNVMLSLDASVGDWAVVFDFGLAKPLEPVKGMYQTSEAIWSGTPMYMAPERFRDPTVMDLRSDIYSLGCIAYYLLTGRPPFSECDPESLFALIISHDPISLQTHLGEPVPETVEKFVRQCMAKSADDRFQSVQKLADRIDELRNEFPWSVDQASKWWKANGDAPGK